MWRQFQTRAGRSQREDPEQIAQQVYCTLHPQQDAVKASTIKLFTMQRYSRTTLSITNPQIQHFERLATITHFSSGQVSSREARESTTSTQRSTTTTNPLTPTNITRSKCSTITGFAIAFHDFWPLGSPSPKITPIQRRYLSCSLHRAKVTPSLLTRCFFEPKAYYEA